MKKCGIYKIESPTKKIYIGQSVDIDSRFKRYRLKDCVGQTALFRSFEKYGVNSHKFEIIIECLKNELNDFEIYYIKLFNSFNSKHGLNLQSGGNRPEFSDETRNKISEKLKGKNKTKGHSKKVGDWHKGKKLSEEHKTKLSEHFTKNPVSFWKGKKLSEEHCKKLSESHKGQVGNKGMLGRKHTEETKKKMRDKAMENINNGTHNLLKKNR